MRYWALEQDKCLHYLVSRDTKLLSILEEIFNIGSSVLSFRQLLLLACSIMHCAWCSPR